MRIRGSCFAFGMALYVWSALMVAGAFALSGCVVGCAVGCGSPPGLPDRAPCSVYLESVHPAPFGTRIVVAADFEPYAGVSYPLPTGKLVMAPVIYPDARGDHLGAIGTDPDAGPDMCRWYAPL